METVNILLVGDQQDSLRNLTSLLEPLSENVVHATSREEAFLRVTERDFAVVLFDIPVHNSTVLETAALLKQHERVRSTPILFLTPHDLDIPEVFNSYPVGMVDYLVKPVVPERLQARIWPFLELFRRTQALNQQIAVRESLFGLNNWSQTALNSIGDAILATDNESRVIFLNPNAEALTGWTQAEALGQDVRLIFNIINEHTRQSADSPIERVLREGIVVGLANHTVLIAKDGTEIPIDDSGAPIHGPSGAAIGAILVFRDVSEQRRIQRLQAQLAAIVESSEDAIISNDLDGIITSWNKGAEHMYGYPAEEIVGKSVALLVPHDWPNDVPTILERIRHGEQVRHYETKRMKKDGTVLDVSLRVSPIYDKDGTIVGASKIARDITDRKDQEQQLALLYEAEQQAHNAAEKANQRLVFLSHASQLLSSSLDYDATFNNLRALILPELADIYSIDVLQEGQALQRVAVVAVEPTLQAWVNELESRSDPQALLQMPDIAAGKSIFFERIPQTLFEATAQDPDHLALLKKIDATSEIIVPLRIRETLIGILTVVRRGSKPVYTSNDVVLMEELAHRIAQAIDNARLYQEAQEQREQLQVTLASIGDAVIATDEHGLITFMNPIAEELTSWQQAEAAGKPLHEVFHIVNEMTRQMVESPVAKVLREGTVVGLANHTLLISKDGREIPIDDSGAPIRTQEGLVAGVILVFRDFTERRQIEQERTQLLAHEQQARVEVQAANQKLQFLTQVSTTLVSSLDYETTLVNLAQLLVPQMADNCVIDLITANASLERVAVAATDPVREEALRELARRFPPDPKAGSTRQSVVQRTPRLVPQLTDAYYEAVAQNAEHLALMKASRGVSMLIVPLFIGERSLGAISLGLVDSRRSYTEADLDLMTEVAHRAAFAVEHARLYREAQQEIHRREQAEQALQDAVRSRDEFLSVAAHELKTPVTSLRGFAQTLLRQLDKRGTLDMAQVERALYVIDQQSTKLTTLVSQLLDISRLEAGRLALERSEIDLPVFIIEVIANVQRGRQYPIVLQAPATLTTWVDPLRLEQVVVNLIDNAVKYSPNREPIQVEISTPRPDLVHLSVTDHGIGIPPERREHLFERFYQAHRDGYQGGMGLGLYISRQIVELHGGRLSVEFPDEGGTRFVIHLPIHDQG